MKRFVKTLYGKSAIVLCLVLLFSLTLISIHRHTMLAYGKEQQAAAVRQQNAIFATDINTAFTMLEENLFYLPSGNLNFQELTQHAEDTPEHWARIASLRRQLSTLQSTCPYVESFFLFYPTQDIFLNEQINPEMSLYIRALVSEAQSAVSEGWMPVQLSEGVYLLRIYAQRGYLLGGWISCDALRRCFTGDAAANTFLYDMAGKPLSKDAPLSSLDLLSAGDTLSMPDGHMLISLAEHPGVYLARRLPNSELDLAAPIGQSSFVMVCLLHILLLALVMAAIAVWVLSPVHALSGGIQRIRGGETDYRMPPAPRYSTEFQEIQREFNAMLDDTQHMRIQMYEQKLQQDEVKLRYLSQQIQPHFILNSLNMLYAYIGREDELARKLVRLLAQYYRYIINIESQYVEIGQEMDHVENYLAFQKVRYTERLNYAIDCDAAVRSVPIPPLLLESFVGNVLKYGQDAQDRIDIHIAANRPDENTVRILIADCGSGFPEEILDALRNYQKTGQKDELLGIGICNSLDRLRLIYGDDASVFFYNGDSHGAVVEIIIRQSIDPQGVEA